MVLSTIQEGFAMDVIIVHGYSSNAESIRKSLGAALESANKGTQPAIPNLTLHYADYVSLDDQVQLEDVAESLFLEIQKKGLLEGSGRTLNFVVHSTGGLVVRQMLMQYDWMELHKRVASIVFLAPANFGSPLAAKGKSQLGRLKTIIVDNVFGDDHYVSDLQFGEVGELILTDLELASPRQWQLSSYDLYHPIYGCLYSPSAIHAAVIVGANNKTTARLFAKLDGTDGVVVTSGCGLSVRRLTLNVVQSTSVRTPTNSWESIDRPLPSIPQLIIEDLNHGTVLTDPSVAQLVLDVLAAESADQFDRLTKDIDQRQSALARNTFRRYQQFALHVVDDRGNPVRDYDISFNVWNRKVLEGFGFKPELGKPVSTYPLKSEQIEQAREADLSEMFDDALRELAYAHSQAPEYRRFLLDYDELTTKLSSVDHILTFSIIAETGDKRIHYATKGVNDIVVYPTMDAKTPHLFFPDTTTQVEIVLDRYSDSAQIVELKPS